MAYTPSVNVGIEQATQTGEQSSLNHTMIWDVNLYTQERVTSFYDIADVDTDVIPVNSPLYAALQTGFKNAGFRSLPIFVGRINPDEIKLAPVDGESVTGFRIRTYDTTTNTLLTDFTASDIQVGGTIAAAIDGLIADCTVAGGIDPTEAVFTKTDADTTLTITPAADRQIVVTAITPTLGVSYTVTEAPAEAFEEIMAENDDDWYYVCCTKKDDAAWTLQLCDVIDATQNTEFPKIFRTSSAALSTLVAQTDPSASDDILGLMEDKGTTRCFGEWHHEAETTFPEVGATCYYGRFEAGAQNWKFMGNANVPVARHPVLGRKLKRSEYGFILDRNAAVRGVEKKVPVYIVGTQGDVARGTGSWMDNVTIADWTTLTMELRLFNKLVNAGNEGRPQTFVAGDRAAFKAIIEGVLAEGVSRKLYSGYDPVFIPSTYSFETQAKRIMDGITFKAYYAGKVNIINVSGVATYREEV